MFNAYAPPFQVLSQITNPIVISSGALNAALVPVIRDDISLVVVNSQFQKIHENCPRQEKTKIKNESSIDAYDDCVFLHDNVENRFMFRGERVCKLFSRSRTSERALDRSDTNVRSRYIYSNSKSRSHFTIKRVGTSEREV